MLLEQRETFNKLSDDINHIFSNIDDNIKSLNEKCQKIISPKNKEECDKSVIKLTKLHDEFVKTYNDYFDIYEDHIHFLQKLSPDKKQDAINDGTIQMNNLNNQMGKLHLNVNELFLNVKEQVKTMDIIIEQESYSEKTKPTKRNLNIEISNLKYVIRTLFKDINFHIDQLLILNKTLYDSKIENINTELELLKSQNKTLNDSKLEETVKLQNDLIELRRNLINLDNELRKALGIDQLTQEGQSSVSNPYGSISSQKTRPGTAVHFSQKSYKLEQEEKRRKDKAKQLKEQEEKKREKEEHIDKPIEVKKKEEHIDKPIYSEEMKKVKEEMKFDEKVKKLIASIQLSNDHIGDFIRFSVEHKDYPELTQDIKNDINDYNTKLGDNITTLQNKLRHVIEQNKIEEDYSIMKNAQEINDGYNKHLEDVVKEMDLYVDYISKSIEEYVKRLKQKEETSEIDELYNSMNSRKVLLEKKDGSLKMEIDRLTLELKKLKQV